MEKCNLVVENGDLYLQNEGGAYGAGLLVEHLPKVLQPKFKKDGRYLLTSYAQHRLGTVGFQVRGGDIWSSPYKAHYVDGGCAICDEFLTALLGTRASALQDGRVKTARVKIKKLRGRRLKR